MRRVCHGFHKLLNNESSLPEKALELFCSMKKFPLKMHLKGFDISFAEFGNC